MVEGFSLVISIHWLCFSVYLTCLLSESPVQRFLPYCLQNSLWQCIGGRTGEGRVEGRGSRDLTASTRVYQILLSSAIPPSSLHLQGAFCCQFPNLLKILWLNKVASSLSYCCLGIGFWSQQRQLSHIHLLDCFQNFTDVTHSFSSYFCKFIFFFIYFY